MRRLNELSVFFLLWFSFSYCCEICELPQIGLGYTEQIMTTETILEVVVHANDGKAVFQVREVLKGNKADWPVSSTIQVVDASGKQSELCSSLMEAIIAHGGKCFLLAEKHPNKAICLRYNMASILPMPFELNEVASYSSYDGSKRTILQLLTYQNLENKDVDGLVNTLLTELQDQNTYLGALEYLCLRNPLKAQSNKQTFILLCYLTMVEAAKWNNQRQSVIEDQCRLMPYLPRTLKALFIKEMLQRRLAMLKQFDDQALGLLKQLIRDYCPQTTTIMRSTPRQRFEPRYGMGGEVPLEYPQETCSYLFQEAQNELQKQLPLFGKEDLKRYNWLTEIESPVLKPIASSMLETIASFTKGEMK